MLPYKITKEKTPSRLHYRDVSFFFIILFLRTIKDTGTFSNMVYYILSIILSS